MPTLPTTPQEVFVKSDGISNHKANLQKWRFFYLSKGMHTW